GRFFQVCGVALPLRNVSQIGATPMPTYDIYLSGHGILGASAPFQLGPKCSVVFYAAENQTMGTHHVSDFLGGRCTRTPEKTYREGDMVPNWTLAGHPGAAGEDEWKQDRLLFMAGKNPGFAEFPHSENAGIVQPRYEKEVVKGGVTTIVKAKRY